MVDGPAKRRRHGASTAAAATAFARKRAAAVLGVFVGYLATRRHARAIVARTGFVCTTVNASATKVGRVKDAPSASAQQPVTTAESAPFSAFRRTPVPLATAPVLRVGSVFTAKPLFVVMPVTFGVADAWPIELARALARTVVKIALASAFVTVTTTAHALTCPVRGTACARNGSVSVHLAGEASTALRNFAQTCAVAMGSANNRLVNVAVLQVGTGKIVALKAVLVIAVVTVYVLKDSASVTRALRALLAAGKRVQVTATTMVFAARTVLAFAKKDSVEMTAAPGFALIIAVAMASVRTGLACVAQVGLGRRATAQYRFAVATERGEYRPPTGRLTAMQMELKLVPVNVKMDGWVNTAI